MKQSRQLIYILPNLFTAGGIFSGVMSLVMSTEGKFEQAAWLILVALIFDGLDGRVARMTNTTSKFGVEFDSLADIVSFGVAPALLLYLFCGNEFGRVGIVVSGLYVVFGAIRLARFNVTTSENEPSVFIGVPIPTAAVFISVLILLYEKYSFTLYTPLLVATLVVAVLMVSNIRYPSFKKIDLQKANFIKVLVALVVSASLIFIFPIESLSLIIAIYLVFGIARAGIYFLKQLRKTKS
ncbi:CDP-diacylglycerol--serine O-phosphatidyltransferase [Sulfurimonas sp. MAG313]|nr:CDP-diacylglycerol--serine O-phosphatidyltransferase [Sulfurimonas sp. MAG313]MDF1881861.1 CDP-diacylglycerol--serine O-phosphatidyltransferase [Sulfurimonas sp. MAG313]